MKSSLLAFGCALLATPFASAVVVFDDGTDHTVNSTVNDFIYIGDSPGGDYTEVVFETGANVTQVDSEDDSLWVYDTSSAIINDGTFAGDVVASDFAFIDILGGTIGDDLQAFGESFITVFGGSILDDIEAFELSIILLLGGSVGEDIEAFDYGIIDIFGGILGDSVRAFDSGEIYLFGSEFYVDGVKAPAGITDISGSSGNISGKLYDGSSFSNVSYERDPDAYIVLVSIPVPDSSLALWGPLTFAGLIAFRRFSKRHS